MFYLLEELGNHCLILLDNKDTDLLKNHSINGRITNAVIHTDYILLTMDLNETYRLGKFEKFYSDAKITLNIDHHQGNFTNADYTLSCPEKSSTCEIVYNIIKKINPDLFQNINLCECIYTGMLTDTNGFSRRLSNETLVIAQKLINTGIDYESIIKRTLQYRTLYQFQALSKLINNLESNEFFHYIIIDKTLPEFANLSHNDIVKILAEELRKIDGIDNFLVMIKNGEKVTTKVVSNHSKIAHVIASHFGGGGHPGEAGFTTSLTTDEIITEAIKFCSEFHNVDSNNTN
jgi:phosphoesterase RecJ-like protein